MYLPDHEIRDEIRGGALGISHYDPTLVQPASIDLRLGRRFLVLRPGSGPMDPAASTGEWDEMECADGDAVGLAPDSFVLASTYERITMPPHLLGRLEGKSSIGRLGIRVHSTAGFIDPGFDGHITLEISADVPVPIVLHPGMRIGQLSIARLSSPARRPYGTPGVGSHYQGQAWPTPSRSPVGFTHGLPQER